MISNQKSEGHAATRARELGAKFYRSGPVTIAIAKAGGNPKRLPKRSQAGGKVPRSGRYNARGRGAKVMRTLPRDTGWKFDATSGQKLRMRRVVVKARYVNFKGAQSRAGYAHLRYLQRDGVDREGEKGGLL